ncbi:MULTISPECIES: OmpA family protein [unclassified Spirosoma]|uniref:OmpA family protein n=1 Tax=unclassified Spirosoma TaxID=2621999 RepID=UPI00095DA1FD|nr:MULTISPECIES: OmpA family protein [unclassified Spirosoma]MBN8822579.1 OmpA family protein [Spirosoma sp.]OJW74074.1 MAG: flagellar motor protein MotB [Spirosoma sp. 48-14]
MRALLSLFLVLAFVSTTYSQNLAVARTQKTLFTISAVDEKTSQEIPAQFTIQAKQAKKKFVGKSVADGKPFAFVLTRTDTLNVIASSPGYYEAEELMVVSCDTCTDYGYVIRLEKEEPKPDSIFRNLQVNQAFRLDNVYFDQSSYVLRPESYPQLNKLIKTLVSTPKLVIEIAGHTDNVGDRRLNQALSENRAKIITNYLVRNGIPENRLRHNGYGDTHPAAPNDTEENKRKNRRVEFVVLAM